MSGSCTDVLSSGWPIPASEFTHTLKGILVDNGAYEPLSGLSGSSGSSRDSTGSSTMSSTDGQPEVQDDLLTDKPHHHESVNFADTLTALRLQYEVGPGLDVERPARLAKYIGQSYPDQLVSGSDLDRLISDIEEKMKAEFFRLENGRLAWEKAVADTLEILQKHVELYELELRDRYLRVDDVLLDGGRRDSTYGRNKNPKVDNISNDESVNVCWSATEPVVESSSAEWIGTLEQMLKDLQTFSANDGSKKWFFFDNAVFLMRVAVKHCAEYSGSLYRIAAHSKGIVQSHVLHVDSLTMKLRTAKLARLGQLNPLGVIEFVEGLFERIEGYSDHLDKIVSTADLRAQKWKAALACSSSLRDTFLGILQHPFFECVPEDVMKEFADIPTIAARTAGKLVELAATEEELPEHIFTGFYGRPSSTFLLIKPPFIGLTGEVFLTGLSQYLGIDFFLDYGCSRSE